MIVWCYSLTVDEVVPVCDPCSIWSADYVDSHSSRPCLCCCRSVWYADAWGVRFFCGVYAGAPPYVGLGPRGSYVSWRVGYCSVVSVGYHDCCLTGGVHTVPSHGASCTKVVCWVIGSESTPVFDIAFKVSLASCLGYRTAVVVDAFLSDGKLGVLAMSPGCWVLPL